MDTIWCTPSSANPILHASAVQCSTHMQTNRTLALEAEASNHPLCHQAQMKWCGLIHLHLISTFVEVADTLIQDAANMDWQYKEANMDWQHKEANTDWQYKRQTWTGSTERQTWTGSTKRLELYQPQ